MKLTPYEVLKIAMFLYRHDLAHPSNKKLEDFVPKAVKLLEMVQKRIKKEK